MLPVEDSVSRHDAILRKGHFLSGKCCPPHGVTGRLSMCYGCYANGFQFDSQSHLADFRFLSLLFFLGQVLCLGVSSVVRLGLGLELS